MTELLDINKLMENIDEGLNETSNDTPRPGPSHFGAKERRDLGGNRRGTAQGPKNTGEVISEARSEEAAETLLSNRQNTHGDFFHNARVSQALKRIMRAEPGWDLLSDVEKESMDMIALKFSRVLSGRPLELQHWEDVEGYARLAVRECKPA